MPLHLVPQSGQPYGSVRKCCEACGRACGPYWQGNTRGHLWTENEKEWSEDPLNCLKVQDRNYLLCDGIPTVEQIEIYETNQVRHRSNYLPPDIDDDE